MKSFAQALRPASESRPPRSDSATARRWPWRWRSHLGAASMIGCLSVAAMAAEPAATNSGAPSTARSPREKGWSFEPIRNPAPPLVRHPTAAAHPIDRFLLAKLEERGLEPAPEADPNVLLRRLTFALTGLPPTPAEVQGFLADATPEAYGKAVDRLLASPRFGERWARHWMDVVRYCESHGSQGDPELPMAWRYRDYLVRAFNQDVPYDQFVREHIAGDLLPQPRINAAENLNESILGTANLRMVEYGYIPVDALEDQVKVVDNQIDVLSKAFLGLTVSCARCHDHKFDPISQRDFYALYGVLASTRPGQVVVDSPELQRKNRAELASLKSRIRDALAASWAVAAPRMPAELLAESARVAELRQVESALASANGALADVEARARAELARQHGAVLPAGLPAPLARWTFEGDLRDSLGNLHGHAEGAAVVRQGRLVLNGTNAWVVTDPLPLPLREKTLEAWVTLDNLEQRGGGALTVQTLDSEVFDSIVFGEREPGRWIAGSDFFNRTRDFGGPVETAQPGEQVHLAIVYRADNSIACYRNGVPYGSSYQQGSLPDFAPGKSRVVLGKRHLGAGVSAFAGEIEEARLYSRALAADEVAASFRAGAATADPATLAGALTPEERSRRSALEAEAGRLRARLDSLRASTAPGSRWKTALEAAAQRETSALGPWVKLEGLEGEPLRQRWRELAARWSTELENRRTFNRTNFTRAWNLRSDDAGRWFLSGLSMDSAAAPAGEFAVETGGDRVLRGLYPAGLFTHALTRKQNAVLSSPRFRIGTDSISVRALGEHAMARVVIENYAIGGGGLFPAQVLDPDEMTWFRLDTSYRKGANAYLEFATAEDFPNPGLRSGGRKFEDGRAYFGASEVVFHDGPKPPMDVVVPAAFVLAGPPPQSRAELAARYGELLASAVAHWRDRQLGEDEAAFLDEFVRRDLLPASLSRLPELTGPVADYRRLEAEIPVPRRAPGVHEAVAFDQPLFKRGQHTQPAEPVGRRFLESLGGHRYSTAQSGRLELAAEIATPSNPLTARVMVNRVWHHLFGRGLVGTVDNFGHLGDAPTHPELLDHLATHFIGHGWSVKELLRYIVTSQAYRQSSLASDDARRLDPGNELLSHARIRRLEAEAIRDAVLAASGQLDLRMGGPGVNVHYVGKTEGGGAKGPLDGDRRRSLYQRIRRNAHNPFLETFDAPKPASPRGRRDSTNVPSQSLALLNDPFLIEQSARWAHALVAEAQPWDQRVAGMFARAFGRAVTAEELAASREFLADLAADHGIAAGALERSEPVWQDFAQSLFCLKEFIYVH